MSKLIRKISNSKGFTLIELLVVIAIIGLLATLAVVSLNNARQKSRDAKRVSDIRQIQTALDLYFLDQNSYPVETTATGLGSTETCLDNGGFKASGCSGTIYMGSIPKDPSSTGTLCTGVTTSDSAGCDYAYSSASGSDYKIYFYLEGPTGNLNAGVHCANQNGIGNSTSGTPAAADCP